MVHAVMRRASPTSRDKILPIVHGGFRHVKKNLCLTCLRPSAMIGDMRAVFIVVILLSAACSRSVEVTVKPGMEKPPDRPRTTVAGAKPELKTGPVVEEAEGPPPTVERVPLPTRQQPSSCPPSMAPS